MICRCFIGAARKVKVYVPVWHPLKAAYYMIHLLDLIWHTFFLAEA